MRNPSQPQFQAIAEKLNTIAPFQICFKDEHKWMTLLFFFVRPFCPDFMHNFTTVIGNRIYFPNREYIQLRANSAARTLAHEMVHILDAKKVGIFFFSIGYLFPQVLALGFLLFPIIGLYALLFLLFLLPFPAPFRAYWESRAYALDIRLSSAKSVPFLKNSIIEEFAGWNYYKMMPWQSIARKMLEKALKKLEKDSQLMRIIHEIESSDRPPV